MKHHHIRRICAKGESEIISNPARRAALTQSQRAQILAKTAGTCHVCGGPRGKGVASRPRDSSPSRRIGFVGQLLTHLSRMQRPSTQPRPGRTAPDHAPWCLCQACNQARDGFGGAANSLADSSRQKQSKTAEGIGVACSKRRIPHMKERDVRRITMVEVRC